MAYELLQEEMKRQNISGYKIAKALGVSTSDMYCALRGTKPMYPKYKLGICELLGKSMEELFPGEEVTEKNLRNYDKSTNRKEEALTRDDIKEVVLEVLSEYFQRADQ